jgi:hypothetical protein
LRVIHNTALRRIFGSRMNEVMGSWRKLHEEFHDLYALRNIRMNRSRRVIGVGNGAYMGEM